jgi:hypothetical protein
MAPPEEERGGGNLKQASSSGISEPVIGENPVKYQK